MILTKKHRIILFVILSFIYILFFSLYSAKALTNTMGRLNYYYYDNGNLNNGTLFEVPPSKHQSIELFDMNFYTSSDEIAEENYFFQISSLNPAVSTYPVKYFSFVFYTLDDITPEFDISVYGGTYPYSDYCNVLNTIQNDNINFYINTCSLPETGNLGSYEVRFNQYNPTLSMSSRYAWSDLYTFDNEEDLIVFISEKQALINKATEEGDLPDIVNNIYNSITSSDIDDSNFSSTIGGWSPSISNNSISNLITLPITFLSGVSTAISGICAPVNYITLYDYQVTLPCLNLSQRLGSVWVIIDTVFSLLLIYSIGKSLVKTFARLSDMDTNIMYECYSEGMTGRSKDL